MIILIDELEVHQNDRNFCARDCEDEQDQKQEPKQVVDLVQPHGREDEEEFDEHSAEGQGASNDHEHHWVNIPCLTQG